MELQAALEPINKENPTGYDIRQHPEFMDGFYSLRDLRNSIRAEERKVVNLDDLHALAAEWKPVKKSCLDILTHQSKDIEVLAWLAEAAIRLDGFTGLSEVFLLINELLSKYWEKLYPLADEEGLVSTLFPLSGLNGDNGEGTLIMPIRMAPVVNIPNESPIRVWDYIKACELAQIQDQDKKNRRIEEGVKTVDQLQILAKSVGFETIKREANAIKSSIFYFSSIESFLHERCGMDAPPTSAIKNILNNAFDALKAIARVDENSLLEVAETKIEPPLQDEKVVTMVAPAPELSVAAPFCASSYYPASREEALIVASRLSLFFEDTEPHSPLSFQIKRVERWGRMGLAELMEELLDDDNARNQFFRLIGLNKGSI